jgi:predicted nuclease with TOPRIM domain
MSNSKKFGGQIQGGIVNIDGDMTFHSEVTVTVNEMRQSLSPSEVNELEDQLKELRTELGNVPSDRIKDAKTVERRVNELVAEADQEEPDKEEVKDRAGKLKKAAKQIEDVLPVVLPIATRIVTYISRSVGI